jgi:hypothetical protein
MTCPVNPGFRRGELGRQIAIERTEVGRELYLIQALMGRGRMAIGDQAFRI